MDGMSFKGFGEGGRGFWGVSIGLRWLEKGKLEVDEDWSRELGFIKSVVIYWVFISVSEGRGYKGELDIVFVF